MKKLFTAILAIVMVASMNIVPAFATSDLEGQVDYVADGVEVTVSHEAAEYHDCLPVDGVQHAPIKRAVLDLSEDHSIDWDIPAEYFTSSADWFETNTQRITLKLKSSPSASVTVKLYDSNSSVVATKTTTLTSSNTTISFTNLTAAQDYYIAIYNNGQQDISVTGLITD